MDTLTKRTRTCCGVGDCHMLAHRVDIAMQDLRRRKHVDAVIFAPHDVLVDNDCALRGCLTTGEHISCDKSGSYALGVFPELCLGRCGGAPRSSVSLWLRLGRGAHEQLQGSKECAKSACHTMSLLGRSCGRIGEGDESLDGVLDKSTSPLMGCLQSGITIRLRVATVTI